MEQELARNLLDCEAEFLTAGNFKPSTLAQKAAGDWRFFERLRGDEPATFSVRKYDMVMRWFIANWPEEAARPSALLKFEAQMAREEHAEAVE